MNHLAHAVLGGDTDDLVLGSVLGDFVHGRVWDALRREVQIGIRLHRAIDVYTDSHPVVRDARNAFVAPWRRYAGILIDVWFDHLLATQFARWHDTPLLQFSARFTAVLQTHREELPAPLRGYLRYMQARGLPAAYAQREIVAEAIVGISTRFRRSNPLAEGLAAILPHQAMLQQAFDGFFPQLRAFADLRRAQLDAAATDPTSS